MGKLLIVELPLHENFGKIHAKKIIFGWNKKAPSAEKRYLTQIKTKQPKKD